VLQVAVAPLLCAPLARPTCSPCRNFPAITHPAPSLRRVLTYLGGTLLCAVACVAFVGVVTWGVYYWCAQRLA
jgi:hypothetical protein